MKYLLPTPRFHRVLFAVCLVAALPFALIGQSFDLTTLDMKGSNALGSGTALDFGPDGRLYVALLKGQVVVIDVKRNGPADYEAASVNTLLNVRNIPNHFDDGTPSSQTDREVTGIEVVGTANNPVIYVPSSDPRAGGVNDRNLDTNSGIITRLSWIGNNINDPNGYWEVVDMVRGLPRSEENHATNGLEFARINGQDFLIVASGGMTNAGGPAKNFAYITEYALAGAVLAVNLTQLESMPIRFDPNTGRNFIYDLPTLDDPTRPNVNGIEDPNDPGYDGIDINDPWGGNDGLNQAKVVPDGPVQIISAGYRNAYDLEVTESGALYVTDNGANGGWGGFPANEGSADVTNEYLQGEPGSSSISNGESVDNVDHLTLVTTNLNDYTFGSVYGGHPNPLRANPGTAYAAGASFPYEPGGAGLFTKMSPNDVQPSENHPDDNFRTRILDPSDPDFARTSLPVDWPPVPTEMADPDNGDWRGPTIYNNDGDEVQDNPAAIWPTNTNAIAEYTATNFGGSMKGNLIAGRSGGYLHRVILNANGSVKGDPEIDKFSTQGNNPLGLTCNGDDDVFPGTIWVTTLDKRVVILEPNDFVICIEPGHPDYNPQDDYDFDGFTNQDERDNGTDPCSGASQPDDFDGDGVSDLNDLDDDNDQRLDQDDPFQIGQPFDLPVRNELYSDQTDSEGNQFGYQGLSLTGLMNNGAPKPNWLNWLDKPDQGPNPNDIMGGAVGVITVNMTGGTARGNNNNQDKGFQLGVNVNRQSGQVNVESKLVNFLEERQLYQYEGDGELGIFIGDGSQSDFIEFVITKEGFRFNEEVDDVPGNNPVFRQIPESERPQIGEPVILRLNINPASAEVTARYRIGTRSEVTLGTLTARGRLRAALQQDDLALAVGIIGTSNNPDAEVQGNWDYIKVLGNTPVVADKLPNIEVYAGSPDQRVELEQYFDDDMGVENLDFSIEQNTNSEISSSISNDVLTIQIPGTAATTTMTVRATDSDGNHVSQTFIVNVLPENQVLYRINSGSDEPYTDAEGNVFQADDYFSEATETYNVSNNTEIADTESDPLYRTERNTDENNAGYWYRFPVANGIHQVRLHFAEIFFGVAGGRPGGAGDRVFDIYAEDQIFGGLDNFDIYKEVGPTRALIKTGRVRVTDGELSLYLTSEREYNGVNRPMVSAIEIFGPGQEDNAPIILTPISDQRSVEGQDPADDLVVIATGGTGTLSFEATNLPPGVALEPSNGDFYGTIMYGAAKDSPYNVTVTVRDSDADPNDAISLNFQWVVDPAEPFWINLDEDENYTERHECSFVQAGEHFFLMGGRESSKLPEIYDYNTDSWTTGTLAPKDFNHFQAVTHDGLIWVLGAFRTANFPDERSANFVWIYDPAADAWIEGPEIPVNRRRGSAGVVVHEGKFYIVGGNTEGHGDGSVPYFDMFDPMTGAWTQMPNAPHARDHFHAAVFEGKLYAVGGRRTGGEGGVFAPLVAEVDVFDFESGTWSTLPVTRNLPTPRASTTTALFEGEIYVIGGEVENSNAALSVVEALDPLTETWSEKESLNHPRHGTQAIVSGSGIFITAGSPDRGRGKQRNMEVYNQNSPAGTPLQASRLNAPLGVIFEPESSKSFNLGAGGGNQGIVITQMTISGQNEDLFSFVDRPALPFYLPAGLSRAIEVNFSGTGTDKVANLEITYNGTKTKTVILTSGDLPDNEAPVVEAGPDRMLLWPASSITIHGSVDDDGLPDGTLELEWTVVEGNPDNITFPDTHLEAPTVEVSAPGNYRLRLSASDSELSAQDEMLLEVLPADGYAGLRYNAGGSSFTTGSGTVFEAEPTGQPVGNSETRTVSVDIDETDDDQLFQEYRAGQSFAYAFPVPIGDYRVRLYLAEVEHTGEDGEGLRTFSATMEGLTRMSEYDIYTEAGAATAIVKSYPDVHVIDDTLNISFTAVEDDAVLMAIEVVGMGDDRQQSVVTDVTDPDLAARKNLDFSLYPNPTQGPVSILLNAAQAEDLTIRVFGTTGKIIHMERFPAGSERKELQVDNLPAGSYLIQVAGSDQIQNKWLLKAH